MGALVEEFPVILGAFWLTIRLTLASAVVALVLGTVLAAMRVSPFGVLRGVATVYVNTLRNTPLTLVIVFCGLGLGLVLDVSFSESLSTNYLWLSIIGLSAYTAAFVCEAIRSGINTVPVGQAEAARALGLIVHPEPAVRRAAAGVPGDHRAAGQPADRADQEHHGRRRDRRGRGVADHEVAVRAAPGLGGRDLLRVRAGLPRAHPPHRPVVRLAGPTAEGGPMSSVLYDTPAPAASCATGS